MTPQEMLLIIIYLL